MFLKILKIVGLCIIIPLTLYILFSILFGEYLFWSDRIIGYTHDEKIYPAEFYIPIDDKKIYLYSSGNSSITDSRIIEERAKGFLYEYSPQMSRDEYYYFGIVPPKISFAWQDVLLSIIYYDNKYTSEIVDYYAWIFGQPQKYISSNPWKSCSSYFWKRKNEFLEVAECSYGRGWKKTSISLSDVRQTDDDGVPFITPKKRSPFLIVSRFGFCSRVWYLDE